MSRSRLRGVLAGSRGLSGFAFHSWMLVSAGLVLLFIFGPLARVVSAPHLGAHVGNHGRSPGAGLGPAFPDHRRDRLGRGPHSGHAPGLSPGPARLPGQAGGGELDRPAHHDPPPGGWASRSCPWPGATTPLGKPSAPWGWRSWARPRASPACCSLWGFPFT